MNQSQLTQTVKALALNEAGFDLVGITSAKKLSDSEQIAAEWLKKGYGGDMSYLNRSHERRFDPSKTLPNAKSVICLAVSYAHPQDTKPASGNFGRVARYAYGCDYHEVLLGRLDKLIELIRQTTTELFTTATFVDSGPLAEKTFARQAGIGFYGKNTVLITPKYGSWIFLAALATTLALDEDAPATGDCQSCEACVKACPTGALLGNYQMDARKCIAYLTIESKNDVMDPALAGRLGNRVYGCDICQEACPQNKAVAATTHGVFYPEKIAGSWIDLDEVRGIADAQAFKRRFAGSPLLRIKKRGLDRNAKAVLGNFK